MKKFLFLFLIISGMILPIVTFAGLPDFKGPYVICGTNNPKTPDCTLCDVFKMAQKIIDLIIGSIILIGPILIAVGGLMILFAGADPGLVGKGKSVIKNVIIGLIIALLAWTVINLIFNELASTDKSKFPAPWNVIECTGGGISKGGYGYQDSSYKCFSTQCNGCAACTSNCIDGTDCVSGDTPPAEGEYCACEVRVYDLDPNTYPNNATVIGTNIKVTKLADKDACKTGCIASNANTYCPTTLKISDAKLYCDSESAMKSKTVCALKIKNAQSPCQISTGKCWDSTNNCAASVTPGTAEYNSAYAKKCFVNGEGLCSYAQWGGGNTFCPKKDPSPCSTATPYTLYRFAHEEESGDGNMDALKCSTYAGDYSCRLNCEYEKCVDSNISEECQQSFSVSPSSGCSNSSECIDIASYTATHDCTSNNGKCLVSSSAASRIQSFISKFKSIASSSCSLKISSTIQGANGPSVSPCHKPGNSNSGTCVDFNLLPDQPTCYKAFYQAAKDSSAVVSFLDEYVDKCRPASATGGNIHTNF